MPANPLQMSQSLFDDRASSKGEVHGDPLSARTGVRLEQGNEAGLAPVQSLPVKSPCQPPVQREPIIGKKAAN
jgi:hypothetical protein